MFRPRVHAPCEAAGAYWETKPAGSRAPRASEAEEPETTEDETDEQVVKADDDAKPEAADEPTAAKDEKDDKADDGAKPEPKKKKKGDDKVGRRVDKSA
ncbi:MAG: hypothetical protein ACR2PO_18895 [Methyloligellaceae bacterium]